MLNALPNSVGSIAKRPGTVPISNTPLNRPIERIVNLYKEKSIESDEKATTIVEHETTSTLTGDMYYVQYTFVNASGESTPSPESEVNVPKYIADPTTAPTLSERTTPPGELLTDTYYVAYTWITDTGETLVSPESSINLSSGDTIDVTIPSLPTGAKQGGIYVGKTSGTLYLNGLTTSTEKSIYSYSTSGDSTPASNTTQNQLIIETSPIPSNADSINIYIGTTSGDTRLQSNITTNSYTVNSDITTSGSNPPTVNTTTSFRGQICTSNKKVYKLNNGDFQEVTMTNPINRTDISAAQFKDDNGEEVLIIADEGDLKAYNGSDVYKIPPADDTDDVNNGLPANDLATINTDHPPIGTTVHNTRVVIWDGSDTIFHSKVGFYDYFPTVNYQRFVKENDYVQTCHTFAGALLVFMRRHIGVLFGDGYVGNSGDWSQGFLDTTDGCINPNTVATVNLPSGKQEVFYLSDHGVHSVYTIDTIYMDNSRYYSTKSMTDEKIDWDSLGVTPTEWSQATGYFYDKRYWLIYPKGDEWHGLVYDTLSEGWYPIDNIDAHDFYHDENQLYLACENGHIKTMDNELYSDWDDKAKTTGTPIQFEWYSKLMTPKLTGYAHFWDILMIEARQFMTKSTLDVEVNTRTGQYSQAKAIKTAQLIWGETEWGESQWSNPELTDVVNEAKRLRTFLKGQYNQVKLSNNRDEPVELFGLFYEVRVMRK